MRYTRSEVNRVGAMSKAELGHIPKVFEELSGVEYLRKVYQMRKAQNQRYSYRAFAEDLGFGPTNYLHLICLGKRALSVRAAEQMASHLGFTTKESRYFVLLAKHASAKNQGERDVYFEEILELKVKQLATPLSRSQLEFFSEWHHAALREMVRLGDFVADPLWISQRIVPHISLEQARKSWQLLLDLGLVAFDSELQKFVQTEQNIVVPAGAQHVSIFSFHKNMAALGMESTTRFKAKHRDVSALTLPMDESLFLKVKEELAILKKKLLQESDRVSNPTEVFQLNLQLFPITLKDTKK
jgi:uncharacterized protein (TIGR02147 family)